MDTLSELARALPSSALLQLTLESGTTLDVPKVNVCLASSVLKHALEAEPDVSSIKVRGSDAAWSRLQLYLHPVPATTHTPMSPDLLLELIPVAHFYDFQPALGDCVSAAKGLSYGADEPRPGSTAADPLAFLAMAEKLQVPELQLGPIKYVSDLVGQVLVDRALVRALGDLAEEYQISETAFYKKYPCSDGYSAEALKKCVQESTLLSPAMRFAILGFYGSI